MGVVIDGGFIDIDVYLILNNWFKDFFFVGFRVIEFDFGYSVFIYVFCVVGLVILLMF